MASITRGFTSYRSKEAYILNATNGVTIDGDIAQYLTGYQLNGVNQLYKNFDKVSSDESAYIYIF